MLYGNPSDLLFLGSGIDKNGMTSNTTKLTLKFFVLQIIARYVTSE